MGYTTEFYGSLTFNKPVTDELKKYINKFNETRRMARDPEKIKLNYPNWKEECFNGELGNEGEYFVGGKGFMGQDRDDSIINYNYPPIKQPGLWCQWIINGDDELVWDEGEKFYNYIEWLAYLISNFFEPLDYVLNGEIEFQGEDMEDFGTIVVTDNYINVEYGIRVSSLSEISDNDLIEEMRRRGYNIA